MKSNMVDESISNIGADTAVIMDKELLYGQRKEASTMTPGVPGRILEFNNGDLSHSWVQSLPHGIPCFYGMTLRKNITLWHFH